MYSLPSSYICEPEKGSISGEDNGWMDLGFEAVGQTATRTHHPSITSTTAASCGVVSRSVWMRENQDDLHSLPKSFIIMLIHLGAAAIVETVVVKAAFSLCWLLELDLICNCQVYSRHDSETLVPSNSFL